MCLRSAFAILTAGPSLLLGAATATACTGEQPTFQQAVRGASAIARVVAIDAPGEFQTVRVVRTLKGTLPPEVLLGQPRTNLCGDALSVDAGAEAIIAWDVPFADVALVVGWLATGDPAYPVLGSAQTPTGSSTLDDVEKAILGALPDTSIARGRSSELATVGAVLLAVALVLGSGRGWVTRRRHTASIR